MGLPLSSAVNLFLRQVVMRRGIPFPLTLPQKRHIETAEMSIETINEALNEGYQSYLRQKGKLADDVFQTMEKEFGV